MVRAVDEDEHELIRRSGVVLRVGKLSLAAGTGSYRVKVSMELAATALGIERHEAHVTLTEITTTSRRGTTFRTEVAEVRGIGINAARLAAITELIGRVKRSEREWTPEELDVELDRIERIGPLYPAWFNALSSGVACGGFSFLVGGWGFEILGAALGAALGQYCRRALLHRGVNPYATTMAAAAVACLVYLAIVRVVGAAGLGTAHYEAGYVAAVLFLVPGFPFVTGALDLARSDFSAGIARLTYALQVLVSAAVSLWAFSVLAGFVPGVLEGPTFDGWARIGLRLVASFAGVLGFALMFNSPPRTALIAAGIGMLANTLRLELVTTAGWVPHAAAALAAVIVGLATSVIAPRLHIPRIVIQVPAVVIMVPGAVAYRAFYALSNGDTVQATSSGFQAALVVLAIAIGLAAARMVTDRAWAFER